MSYTCLEDFDMRITKNLYAVFRKSSALDFVANTMAFIKIQATRPGRYYVMYRAR